jgi:proteasome lid subunit RPN8/RPN11
MRAIRASGYTGNVFCPISQFRTNLATNAKQRSVNPRRLDPTRTVSIRRRWQAEFKRRVAQLRRDLRQLVAKEDAFGLGQNAPVPLVFHSFCPTGPGGGIDPTCSPGRASYEHDAGKKGVGEIEKRAVEGMLRESRSRKVEMGFLLDEKTGEVFPVKGGRERLKSSEEQKALRYDQNRQIVDVHTHPAGSLHPPSTEDLSIYLHDPDRNNSIIRAVVYSEDGNSKYSIVPLKRMETLDPLKKAYFFAGKATLPASYANTFKGEEQQVVEMHSTLLSLKNMGYIRYEVSAGPKTSAIFEKYTGLIESATLPGPGEENRQNLATNKAAENEFCPTGPGGGVDPTCSPGGGGGSQKEFDFAKESKVSWKDVEPLGHDQWKDIPADPSYYYHATHLRNARDITESSLEPHGPSYGTEQDSWPDGSTQDRSYFSPSPSTAWMFAPEGGKPVLLRVSRSSADFKTESSTGDIYSRKSIDPKHLEIATDRGWVRLSSVTTNLATNTRFSFMSSPQKVEQFRLWLAAKTGATTLAKISRFAEDHWWKQYVEEGYAKGAGRAFEDVNKAGALKEWAKGQQAPLDFYEGTKRDFLRSAFARPVAVEKVKLLAGRSYTDIQGVTEQMATKVTRALTDGLVQGWSPREVAKEMDGYLDAYENQALAVARTETVRAHAEGQLDALEELGVDEVGVMVEWSTSGMGETGLGNPSPCEECAEMEGVVLTIEEMRGMIPRHPNCMCSIIPANVGEDQEGQIRGQSSIERAILRSVEREGQTPESSSWLGSDTDIARVRPESLVTHVFCPTGEGGGVDPTCPVGGGGVLPGRYPGTKHLGSDGKNYLGQIRELEKKDDPESQHVRDLLHGVMERIQRKLEKSHPGEGHAEAAKLHRGLVSSGGSRSAAEIAKEAWDDDRTATAISKQTEVLIRGRSPKGEAGQHAAALLKELEEVEPTAGTLYRGLSSYDLKGIGPLEKGTKFDVVGLKSFTTEKEVAQGYGAKRVPVILRVQGKSRSVELPAATVAGGERLMNGKFLVTKVHEEESYSDVRGSTQVTRIVTVRQEKIHVPEGLKRGQP